MGEKKGLFFLFMVAVVVEVSLDDYDFRIWLLFLLLTPFISCLLLSMEGFKRSKNGKKETRISLKSHFILRPRTILWCKMFSCTSKNYRISQTWRWNILESFSVGYKFDQSIVLAVREFAKSPGDRDSIQGRVILKTQKTVFDASLLNTQHYKVWIKGKVEQSRERSSALPYTSV